MSASSKKKIRKEQEAELLTQRQQQEQKEAKKLKLITIAFITGLAVILAVFAGIMISDGISASGVVGKWTTVATIGEHKLSLTDFNYYYVDAVSETSSELYSGVSEFSEQLSMSNAEAIKMMTGVDVTKPLTQLTNEATGNTYADDLVQKALENAARDYALYDAAQKAGFKLSAEEQANIDSIPETLDNYATLMNYGTAKNLLRLGWKYGEYATVDSYVKYQERSMIADAYYEYYTEQLTYDDAALRKAEGENPENYNSYSYAYYTVKVEDFLEGGTTAEDGTVTYSDTEKEAARAAAEAAANELTSATTIDEFDDKVAHLFTEETEETTEETTEEATEETETTTTDVEEAAEPDTTEADATEPDTTEPEDEIDIPLDTTEGEVTEENTDGDAHDHEHEQTIKSMDVLHSGAKEDFRTWMADANTVKGSMTVIPAKGENDEITGYYVVYMMAKTDNKKAPVNVRHILVEVTDTENEDAWTEALNEAEALLAEYNNGEKTEESFTALVHDNTDDTGSAETGGLYEGVRPTSSYVDGFLDWCIDDARKAGDVEIVKTEYGYHLMYFVEHQEQAYRDYLISNELRNVDSLAWENGLVAKYTITKKNMKKVDKDMVSLEQVY